MTRLAKAITNTGFNLCSVYCADGTFVTEPSKYLSACLTSVSTMTQLSLPHLNLLTKCDKVQDKQLLDRMCLVQFDDCFENEESYFNKKYLKLNKALFDVLENFSMVQYTTCDISDENSLASVVILIDSLVQYDEYRMPKDSTFADN